MTKHRRSDSDWTRRPSPFFASLGQSTVECSVPVARPETLAELATILTAELKGILIGAGRIHAQMMAGEDWKSVTRPKSRFPAFRTPQVLSWLKSGPGNPSTGNSPAGRPHAIPGDKGGQDALGSLAPAEPVRRAVLRGPALGSGPAVAGRFRGPLLRAGQPDDPREEEEGLRARQLGVPREEDRRLGAGLPAADHPEEDRGARRLLPPVRRLGDPAGDPRQRAARLGPAPGVRALERPLRRRDP